MAWRQGDTAAFNAVMTAGDKARSMYEKYLAGQAYKEGSAVTNPEDAATQEARRDVAANVAGPQPGAEFDSYDFQQGGLGATAPAQQEYTDAANRASQAATRGAQYKVGLGDNQVAYDQAPTRGQMHRGGLGAQAARLSGMGKTEEANRVYDTMEAGDDRDYARSRRPVQEEVQRLAIEKGRRDEKREILSDEVRASAVSMTKRYVDAQIALQGGNYGPFKSLIEGDYNGNKPGLDDSKKIRFDGDDGISITNEKGFGSTRPLTPKVAEQMLEYGLAKQLSALSPEHFKDYRDFKLKREENESTAAYRARVVSNAEEKLRSDATESGLRYGKGGIEDQRLGILRSNASDAAAARTSVARALADQRDDAVRERRAQFLTGLYSTYDNKHPAPDPTNYKANDPKSVAKFESDLASHNTRRDDYVKKGVSVYEQNLAKPGTSTGAPSTPPGGSGMSALERAIAERRKVPGGNTGRVATDPDGLGGVDPLAATYAFEQREMDAGRLGDYSPEVKSWLESNNGVRNSFNRWSADRAAGSEDFLQRELKRGLSTR